MESDDWDNQDSDGATAAHKAAGEGKREVLKVGIECFDLFFCCNVLVFKNHVKVLMARAPLCAEISDKRGRFPLLWDWPIVNGRYQILLWFVTELYLYYLWLLFLHLIGTRWHLQCAFWVMCSELKTSFDCFLTLKLAALQSLFVFPKICYQAETENDDEIFFSAQLLDQNLIAQSKFCEYVLEAVVIVFLCWSWVRHGRKRGRCGIRSATGWKMENGEDPKWVGFCAKSWSWPWLAHWRLM